MNKTVSAAVTLAVSFLLLYQCAFANDVGKTKKEVQRKFGLGIEVSYFRISDATWMPNETAKLSTPPYAGINLAYIFNDYVSSELSVQSLYSDMEIDVGGTPFNYGILEQIPIFLTARSI